MIDTEWTLCEDPQNRGVDDTHFATDLVPGLLPQFFEILLDEFEARS